MRRILSRVAWLSWLALSACSSNDEATGPLAHCPTRGGMVGIEGGFDFCPVVRSAEADPISAPIGQDILLTVSAVDGDSNNLFFRWAASSGTIADPNVANTTYQCVTPGQASLTITVSDGICADSQGLVVLCR
jgi:hypothetical protein